MVCQEKETILRARGAGSTGVQRQGNVVLRPAGPWTPTVHSLLRHLRRGRILRRSACLRLGDSRRTVERL